MRIGRTGKVESAGYAAAGRSAINSTYRGFILPFSPSANGSAQRRRTASGGTLRAPRGFSVFLHVQRAGSGLSVAPELYRAAHFFSAGVHLTHEAIGEVRPLEPVLAGEIH